MVAIEGLPDLAVQDGRGRTSNQSVLAGCRVFESIVHPSRGSQQSRPLLALIAMSARCVQPGVAVECSGYILEELRDETNYEQFKADMQEANFFIGSLIFVQVGPAPCRLAACVGGDTICGSAANASRPRDTRATLLRAHARFARAPTGPRTRA